MASPRLLIRLRFAPVQQPGVPPAPQQDLKPLDEALELGRFGDLPGGPRSIEDRSRVALCPRMDLDAAARPAQLVRLKDLIGAEILEPWSRKKRKNQKKNRPGERR